MENLNEESRRFTPIDRQTYERLELRIAKQNIPRGRRWQRFVIDLNTGKRYRAWSKSCGLPGCLCDAFVEELKTPPAEAGI